MSIDINAFKLAEEEVRSLKLKLEKNVEERSAELEATIRDLEAFSYNISHSVRAPLRGIHGYATILANEFSPQRPASAGEYFKKSKRARDG